MASDPATIVKKSEAKSDPKSPQKLDYEELLHHGTFSPEASSSQASTKTTAWPEFEAGLPEFYGFDYEDMQQDPNMEQVF